MLSLFTTVTIFHYIKKNKMKVNHEAKGNITGMGE